MRKVDSVELEENILNTSEMELLTYIDERDENPPQDIRGVLIGVIVFLFIAFLTLQMSEILQLILPESSKKEAAISLIKSCEPIIGGFIAMRGLILPLTGEFKLRDYREIYIITDKRILCIGAIGNIVRSEYSIDIEDIRDIEIYEDSVVITDSGHNELRIDDIKKPQEIQDEIYRI
jgi:hypothetical protein